MSQAPLSDRYSDLVNAAGLAMTATLGSAAFASLLTPGKLQVVLPLFIVLGVLANAAMIGIANRFSSVSGHVVTAQDKTPLFIVPLAVALSSIDLPVTASAMIILIALSTSGVLSGMIFLVLHRSKGATILKFFPRTVIVGLFCATGAQLVIVGAGLSLSGTQNDIVESITVFAVALLLLIISIKRSLGLLLPAGFIIILANIGLYLNWVDATWFHAIPTLEFVPNWEPIPLSLPTIINEIGPPVLLGVLATVATGIVSLTVLEDRAARSNELRAIGFANIAGGLLAGGAGYTAAGPTRLVQGLGGNSKRLVLVAAILMVPLAFAMPFLLPLIPKVLLAGLLGMFGLLLLEHWAIRVALKMRRQEQIKILVMVAISIAFSLESAVLFGLGLAMLMTTAAAAKCPPILSVGRGFAGFCYSERPQKQSEFLVHQRDNVIVIRLQGFLFFAHFDDVLDTFQQELAGNIPDVVIVDCTAVTGADIEFTALWQEMRNASKSNLELIIVKPQGWNSNNLGDIECVQNFTIAIIKAEEKLLEKSQLHETTAKFSEALCFLPKSILDDVLASSRLVTYSPEEVVMQQGTKADYVLFLEQGQLRAERNGNILRILAPGVWIGEYAALLGGERTATIKADKSSKLRQLSIKTIDALPPEWKYALRAEILGAALTRRRE